METYLDFEKPIAQLEKKLQDLREMAKQEGMDFSQEIKALEKKVDTLTQEVFSKLTSWQKVQLSRHPNRPHSRDYIDALFPDFMELAGDRAFGEDAAIVGGVATWPPRFGHSKDKKASPAKEQSVLIIGHQKGRTTKQKMERNFGMAKPEGYRKAIRLFQLAERARMPVLTLIDTPGAYPGLDAEERGQSQAIADSIRFMFTLTVPVIAVVVGEGGSGGALAVGVANKVLMQEYSTYSVISPESCASILWSDAGLAERASEKLKMNPNFLLEFKVIDAVVPEPRGGAHRNWNEAFDHLQIALLKHFEPLFKTKPQELYQQRMEKFRAMGDFALVEARQEGQDEKI